MLDKLINLLKKQIEYCLSQNDLESAFNTYARVKKWLDNNQIKNKEKVKYKKIIKLLYKLKFISLNYFDRKDVIDLLKNQFPLIFDLPYYDLYNMLEVHLLSISEIDERAEFKKEMKEALLKCDAYLFSPRNYKDPKMVYKVNEWLNNFFINIDINLSNSYKEAEYLSNNSLLKKLKKTDKSRVLKLLEIYKKLNLPSDTKEGYEAAVAGEVDGKTYILSQGQVERLLKFDLINTSSDDETEDSEKKQISDVLDDEAPDLDFKSESIKEKNISTKNLSEIKKLINEYPKDSLEHKALEEELVRLKKKKSYDK